MRRSGCAGTIPGFSSEWGVRGAATHVGRRLSRPAPDPAGRRVFARRAKGHGVEEAAEIVSKRLGRNRLEVLKRHLPDARTLVKNQAPGATAASELELATDHDEIALA